MKINVPTIRSTTVGVRMTYGTDLIFDCPNRPNVIAPFSESPIIEHRLAALTVFDRDLRVADRLVGVCQLAILATGICIMIPMAVLFFTFEALTKIMDFLGDRVGDLMRASGIPSSGSFSGAFRALSRKVFAA